MIDYERLYFAVNDAVSKNTRDINSIIANSALCWDDTAVKVNYGDSELIFDLINYELAGILTADLIFDRR